MNMEAFEIIIYSTSEGKEPFNIWLQSLDDKVAQRLVLLRLQRLRLGLFGDCKSISGGHGLQELRIAHGPGLRIYFAKVKNSLLLLIGGGDKNTQSKDIKKCQIYLEEYKEINL